ncbi:MAG: hypothetical protein QG651_511, partial [Pseudomonadota bacterium]|nr:hypothetical protein [Pseudomonadota bacterium]
MQLNVFQGSIMVQRTIECQVYFEIFVKL